MTIMDNKTQISTNYTTTTNSPIFLWGFAVITAAYPTVSLDESFPVEKYLRSETCFETEIPTTMLDLVGLQMNQKFLVLDDRLNQFKSLENGWNGYDAAPIPLSVLDAAKSFLRSLRAGNINLNGWEIFPTARETIQFEKTIDNDYVEVEIYADGHMAFYSEGRQNLEMDIMPEYQIMEKISSAFA